MCKVKFVSVFVLLALLLSASVSMAQEPPLVSATSPGATPTRYRFEQVNEDMEYIAHGEFAGGLTHEVFEFSDGSAFERLLTPDAAYWRRPDWEAAAGWHKVELELVGPLNALLTPSYLLQIVTTAKAEVQILDPAVSTARTLLLLLKVFSFRWNPLPLARRRNAAAQDRLSCRSPAFYPPDVKDT